MYNNLFRSGLLVRTAHVTLTLVTMLTLFLHDTDLRKYEDSGDLLQPVMFSMLVLISVMLYFTVSLMDPGFVLTDSVKLTYSVSEELEERIPQSSKFPRQRRCGYCLLQQPMRAKHCQSCKHCVRRFDHHCPWIENCVGERNHRLFILYLIVQLLVLLWALHIAWSGILDLPTWKLWFSQNGLLLAALGIISVFCVVVLLLLSCHLYLVSINTTTWEFMSHQRISYLKSSAQENPFDRGVFGNLWDFFCICRIVIWEQVYTRQSVHPV